jgi:hypothetical protein
LISYVLGLLEFMFCDCLGWTNLWLFFLQLQQASCQEETGSSCCLCIEICTGCMVCWLHAACVGCMLHVLAACCMCWLHAACVGCRIFEHTHACINNSLIKKPLTPVYNQQIEVPDIGLSVSFTTWSMGSLSKLQERQEKGAWSWPAAFVPDKLIMLLPVNKKWTGPQQWVAANTIWVRISI